MFKLLLSAVTVAWSLIALTLTTQSASAERRIALIIGNASYKNQALNLPNPKNDATDVAAVLKALDFEVFSAVDANKRDMEMAMQKFARAAIDADSALFFYAGHAMQYRGRNYLMPVDAELEDEFSLRYQMVPIDDVRSALDAVNGVKIMILDACRNNPLAERLARQQTGFTRAIGATRGLARVDKTQGMVVAYATAADDVAADGNGRNSPFTQALLKRLQEPGLEIEMMFRRVASDVNNNTGGRQRPETYISLLSEYYLNQSDRLEWDRIKDSSDTAALREFIARFPSSIRTLDARYRLEMLERFARERELERQRMQREMQAKQEGEERARLAEVERQRRERDETEQAKAAEQARVAEGTRLRREREDAERKEAEDRTRLAEAERARKAREAEEQTKLAAAEKARLQQEAVEKARVAEAERARKVQEEAEQREAAERTKLAEAERIKQEQESAERRKAEEKTRIAEAARLKKEREAEEKARIAEAARLKKEREEAQRHEAEERARVAVAEKVRKEREVAERKQAELQAKAAEAERVRREAEQRKAEEQAKLAEAERARKERLANEQHEQQERARLEAADKSKLEQVCKQEDERLALLQAAGTGAREELIRFEREMSCDKLRPVALASLNGATTAVSGGAAPVTVAPQPAESQPADAGRPNASLPTPTPQEKPVNTIELVSAAQTEMKRLGCFSGSVNGKLDAHTKSALRRYIEERDTDLSADVNDELIQDMKDQTDKLCVASPTKKKQPATVRREEPARPVHRQERREAAPRPAPARVAAQPVRPAASGSRPAPKVLGVGF